jgi:two-component system sensor histidine kinase RegB
VTDIPSALLNDTDPESGRISLRTLVPIRWVAVAGQALALLLVHYGLGFHLRLIPALAVVGASALLNIVLIVRRQVARELSERYAALCLGYDLLQLAILLYLTGGLENPFSILFLAPVTVAATILSRRLVIALSILAIAAISALALWHLPLPWRTEPLVFPPEIIFGAWTALVLNRLYRALHLECRAGCAPIARCGGGNPACLGA